MSEVYFSVDVESSGPIPGPYSMLSFGAAAYDHEGKFLGEFTRNLTLLEGAGEHPETKKFWLENPEAFKETRVGIVPPSEAMLDFRDWIKSFPGTPVFVAYPAGFDFTFIYWYFHNFIGECPFGFSALDMKTLGMSLTGSDFKNSTKKKWPKKWFLKSKHNHVALDDAKEQGEIFCRMWLLPNNVMEVGN